MESGRLKGRGFAGQPTPSAAERAQRSNVRQQRDRRNALHRFGKVDATFLNSIDPSQFERFKLP